jgi:hypothetical protein
MFGITLTEVQIEAYLKYLGDLTPEQVDRACDYIARTWKPTAANPYPAICDILAACGESPDEGVILDILDVKKMMRVGQHRSVSFCDRALHHVIMTFAGGWVELFDWDQKTWDVNLGRMTDAYRNAMLCGLDGPNHLAGITERGSGWDKVIYQSLRDPTVKGEIPFRGGLTSADMEKLDELCRVETTRPALLKEPPTMGYLDAEYSAYEDEEFEEDEEGEDWVYVPMSAVAEGVAP